MKFQAIRYPVVALSVLLMGVACDSKEAIPTEELGAEPSPAASNVDAGDPDMQLSVTAVAPNPTGISPMDVVNGTPTVSPTPPTSPGSKVPDGLAADPELPPGIPIPDFNKIIGHGNWKVESVTRGVAAPGDGPRGPDGKVIDPNTLIKQASVPTAPGPEEASAEIQIIDPASVGEGIRLDPSEAPKLPPLPQSPKSD